MELEGNLILERRPARRWISVTAVIVPVVACLAGVTWFVRAFISPPTIAIPSPMSLAAAPPAPPVQAEPPAAQPAVSAAPVSPAPAPSPLASSNTASVALPMFATLAAAPPTFSSAAPGQFTGGVSAAYADPARDFPATNMPAAADAMVDATPLAGPIPMPRPRPQAGPQTTAALADAVPLPRARPGEEPRAQVQEIRPAFDRHGAE
jgi:hypothetical protein